MKILKIAICDDEAFFAEKLKKTIDSYCRQKHFSCDITIYQSGREFLADRVKVMEYQIVFLDISMKGLNGLDTAKELRKICRDTFLIFVTAYIDYTIEGYKVEAIRYLLKSNKWFGQSVRESLDAVFEKMEYKPKIKSFFFQEGNLTLPLDTVVFVESSLHKLYFHIWDGEMVTYSMYDTLNSVSKEFDENFLRIHQSYLVNLQFIKKIDSNAIVLSNNATLPISRSRLREVKSRVAAYRGRI